MALDPLATTADLDARDIPSTDEGVPQFLADASVEVRDAAGVPISRETFTTEIPGTCDQWLHLPGQPVVSVSAVLIDGDAVTDYKLVGGHLWRAKGWQGWEPSVVTPTLTGGLTEIPDDIVNLVCSMVASAINRKNDDGYASRGDVAGERIDDYSIQYASSGSERLAGPMELPQRTRERLRARFGNSAAMVTTR